LDGGLPAWEQQGRSVDSSAVAEDAVHAASAAAQSPPSSPRYPAKLRPGAVVTMQRVRELLESGNAQVVDARAAGRFKGEQPEPRADIPSGHMRGRSLRWLVALRAGGR